VRERQGRIAGAAAGERGDPDSGLTSAATGGALRAAVAQAMAATSALTATTKANAIATWRLTRGRSGWRAPALRST
jgi:hypothetical protein